MSTRVCKYEAEQPVPSAIFIEDIVKYITEFFAHNAEGVEEALSEINQLYTKYKFMEAQLLQKKRSMSEKIPEIQRAIDSLEFFAIKQGDEVSTSFELSECAYVQAKVVKSDKVLLWLGANVMVEYPREEALELLNNNLSTAKKSFTELKDQADFVKDQITVSEVNVARLHNYKVEKFPSKPKAQ